jgi:hypothetical protein
MVSWKKWLALLALIPIFALEIAPAVADDRRGCQKGFENLGKTSEPLFNSEISVEELIADHVYSAPKSDGSCCIHFSLSKQLIKELKDRHHRDFAKKALHSLSRGVVGDHGAAGIKSLHHGFWEVKTLGVNGDARILGCLQKNTHVIAFTYFAPDHKAADRYLKEHSCH